MALQTDGHGTFIKLAGLPNAKFKEKTTTPPGIEGGDPNDTTTMHNVTYRSKMPRVLKEMTPASATVAYDPAVLPDIVAQVNVNQLITIEFPDGEAWVFYGYLKNFIPNENQEGEQPTADIEVVPTLLNAVLAETAPTFLTDTSYTG